MIGLDRVWTLVHHRRLRVAKKAAEASRSEKAEFENDVLVVDDYGRLKFRPLLQWLSPRKLQLVIPNISAIGLQKSSYRDVEIVIRYEPDDPAAREKWQKERGVVAK